MKNYSKTSGSKFIRVENLDTGEVHLIGRTKTGGVWYGVAQGDGELEFQDLNDPEVVEKVRALAKLPDKNDLTQLAEELFGSAGSDSTDI